MILVNNFYGNSKEEAIYPLYRNDAAGNKLDATTNKYTLTFKAGELPPVNAFWSLTMYDLPQSLMVANPINRYLINSPMLPELKKNASVDRNTFSFSLVDQDRNKIDDTRWLYEYRELPTMKFQVCFSQIGKDTKYFLGKIDEPTTSVTMQEVVSMAPFVPDRRQSTRSVVLERE